jgi:hypothetical protein
LERGAKSREAALLMVVQRGRLSEGREAVWADQACVEAEEPGGVRAKDGDGEGLARRSL